MPATVLSIFYMVTYFMLTIIPQQMLWGVTWELSCLPGNLKSSQATHSSAIRIVLVTDCSELGSSQKIAVGQREPHSRRLWTLAEYSLPPTTSCCDTGQRHSSFALMWDHSEGTAPHAKGWGVNSCIASQLSLSILFLSIPHSAMPRALPRALSIHKYLPLGWE